MGARARRALVVSIALWAAACTGGSSGGGGGGGLAAPGNPAAVAGDGQITVSWSAVAGATSYDLYWSTTSGVTPISGNHLANVQSPYLHSGRTNGTTYYYVVTASDATRTSAASAQVSATPSAAPPTPYAPAWANPGASQTLTHAYNSGLNAIQNGNLLANAILALMPGQRLVVDGGTYSMVMPLKIALQGTASDPIEIVAAANETPVITRADDQEDVLEIGGQGGGPSAEYLLLRGFRITGGDAGVRLHRCSHVWLDGLEVTGTGPGQGSGIIATTESADHLTLTRNHVHDTNGFGEGIRLGSGGAKVVRDSVIALNHIHDTPRDGILLRHGCHSNRVVENTVHHTGFPCVRFYGTGGQPRNVIERNVLYHSGDNVLQAEDGEALVRNNLLVGPAGNKLLDSSHGDPRDLEIVHNTILGDQGYGVGLFAWNGQPGLVFANNAVYVKTNSQNEYALSQTPGNAGGTLTGNVIVGVVKNFGAGWGTVGNGVSDFEGVAGFGYAFANVDDVIPAAAGALIDSGNPGHAVSVDLVGAARALPLEAGCRDAP